MCYKNGITLDIFQIKFYFANSNIRYIGNKNAKKEGF
jgi:hypothetical protein